MKLLLFSYRLILILLLWRSAFDSQMQRYETSLAATLLQSSNFFVRRFILPRWSCPVCLLVYFGEMRQIFETYVEAGFRYLLFPRFDQVMSSFEAPFDDPFLRCQVAHFSKIPFERGQAAPRVACDFLHRQVAHIVLVQVIKNVYFPRFDEIEQRSIKVPVRVE